MVEAQHAACSRVAHACSIRPAQHCCKMLIPMFALLRDSVRDSFLRSKGSAISPAQGRHPASMRSISPRRSSFTPHSSSENWDNREGPPLPARPLPLPPPLPAGNLSTPRYIGSCSQRRRLPLDGFPMSPGDSIPKLSCPCVLQPAF